MSSYSGKTFKPQFWMLALATAAGAGWYYYTYHMKQTMGAPLDVTGRKQARHPGRRGQRAVAVETAGVGQQLREGIEHVLPTGIARALPGGGQSLAPVPALSGNADSKLSGQYLHSLRTRNSQVGLQGGAVSGTHVVPRAVVDNTPLPGAAMAPESHNSLYAGHGPGPKMISPPVLSKCYTPFEEHCTRQCGTSVTTGSWPEPMYVHGQSRCERRVNPIAQRSVADAHSANGGAAADGYFHIPNNALALTATSMDDVPSAVPTSMLPGME